MVIRHIEPSAIAYLKDAKLKVLRNKNGMAIDVSYTEDGLKWSSNSNGTSRYYENAVVSDGKIIPTKGKLSKRKDVYVEDFIPEDKRNEKHQAAELSCIKKAYKMFAYNSVI